MYDENNELNHITKNIEKNHTLIPTDDQNNLLNKEETAQEIIQESIQETTQEVTHEAIQEPVQEVIQENIQENIKETTQEVVHETIKEPVQEVIQETIKDTVQEVIEETIQETTQEVIQENIQEPVQENIEDDRFQKPPYTPIKDTYYHETVKGSKKKKSFKNFIAACLVVSLFGGAGIGGSYAFVNNILGGNSNTITTASNNQNGVTTTTAQALSSTAGTLTAVDVIDAVYPSVVNISTVVSGTTNYFGFSMPYEGAGSGSGVIFATDENNVYIVTNNHVIDGASNMTISVTGEEQIPATVIATESSSDLAVISALKTDFYTAGITNIIVAQFGNSDEIKVGEPVIAIGNALGEGKSATDGMISMSKKNIEVNGKSLDVIQTSAPINSGNSGGALVNFKGEIIGINTAKTNSTVAEAMGYAIPSNTVKEIMEKLLIEGTTPKPYLGIMGSDITDDIADMYKLPIGVLVRQVFEGGSAAVAGLVEGDIIVSFDGKTIMNMESLVSTLAEKEVGDVVSMNIIRDSSTPMTLSVTIQDANAQGK